MTDPSPEAIKQALAQHSCVDDFELPGRIRDVPAATMVPLRWQSELMAIATVRTAGLRLHGGEVCFPGGTPDSPDEDLQRTALREAHEELGIESAQVLGRLSRMPVYTSNHRITPWVTAIDDAVLRPQPEEVAHVLEIPLLALLRQPALEGLPFPLNDGHAWSPLFHLNGHIMFGATAHTLLELLTVLAPLYGLEVPPMKRGKTRWADILPPELVAEAEA